MESEKTKKDLEEFTPARMEDYAVVALRMLNQKYDFKMEEEYLSMLDLALGFIPTGEINKVQISCKVPNINKYMDKDV